MDEGKRFSHVYLERTEPVKDSPRFRNRLGSYCYDNFDDGTSFGIIKIIKKETGADIPLIRSTFSLVLEDFFKKNAMRDILDSITLMAL